MHAELTGLALEHRARPLGIRSIGSGRFCAAHRCPQLALQLPLLLHPGLPHKEASASPQLAPISVSSLQYKYFCERHLVSTGVQTIGHMALTFIQTRKCHTGLVELFHWSPLCRWENFNFTPCRLHSLLCSLYSCCIKGKSQCHTHFRLKKVKFIHL